MSTIDFHYYTISHTIIFLFEARDLFTLFMFPIAYVESVLEAFRSRRVILLKHR